MVEHRPFKPLVEGSSPSALTIGKPEFSTTGKPAGPPTHSIPADMDPEYLSILMCPKTRGTLRAASPDEVARANEVLSSSGSDDSDPVEEGLVSDQGAVFYPIRDGIPVLLASHAISLAPAAGAPPASDSQA